MKLRDKIICHSIFWIFRTAQNLINNIFLWGFGWYVGAFWVHLIMMPFFYVNYGFILPRFFMKGKMWKFAFFSLLWVLLFVYIYSRWTIYQRYLLYGEELWSPSYIQTFNNIIILWISSSAFYFLEIWVSNRKNNLQLSFQRKEFELKAQKNKMLLHFLPSFLEHIGKVKMEMIPEKILVLADFLKYILYTNGKKVTLHEELEYVYLFQTLLNTGQSRMNISQGTIDANFLIHSSEIIYSIDKIIEFASDKRSITIRIETKNNRLFLFTDLNEMPDQENNFSEAFQKVIYENDGHLTFLVKQA